MPPIPETEKKLAARVAAETSWANTANRAARTAPARAALFQKFLDEADGDETRAQHLWRAHFARLALKSAQTRRRAREATTAAETVEAELRALGADQADGAEPGEGR